MKSQEQRDAVIRDCKRGEAAIDVALRHGIGYSTVGDWARAANLDRKRGSRVRSRPTVKEWEIVNVVRQGLKSFHTIGVEYGTTRQNINRIYHRWNSWKPVPLYRVGDKIRHRARDGSVDDYVVVKADTFTGVLRSLATKEKITILWIEDVQRKPAETQRRNGRVVVVKRPPIPRLVLIP